MKHFTLGVILVAASCLYTIEYEDPEPFCERAFECWDRCEGDLQCEAECKWEWPNDWQGAAAGTPCQEEM